MRIPSCTFLFAAPLLAGTFAFAAQPSVHFKPGEWKVDSVTTVAGGRSMASSTSVCANKQGDLWKVHQTGLTCKTPVTQTGPGNQVRVHIECRFNRDYVVSDIVSDVTDTFSDDGNSFTSVGTTQTETSFHGMQARKSTAKIRATAKRIGDCK